MKIAARLIEDQAKALDSYYGDDQTNSYRAKVLAFAITGCAVILFCALLVFVFATSNIIDSGTKVIFVPYISATLGMLGFNYYLLRHGHLESARRYFSLMFFTIPAVTILITGGFPHSDASPLLMLPPIIITLLYGNRLGMSAALILPFAAIAQWILFVSFGNPFPDFTSTSNPIVNYLIIFATTYAVAICIIAAFQHHNQHLNSELEKLATLDELTGLCNRRNFQDMLAAAQIRANRECTKFAVIYLDLDGFKPVNDQYGHRTGDKVLRQIADRMRQCVGENDIIARFGGDEFAILTFESVATPARLKIEDKVRREISFPISVDNNLLQIGVSMGSSIYPDSASNIDELIDLADKAMYENKADIQNGINNEISVQNDDDLITVENLYYRQSA